jgi:hypothetical protein
MSETLLSLHYLFAIYPYNGYLAHPFEKEILWAFTACLFLVVSWHSAIVIAGEWVSWTGENRNGWAADYQKSNAQAPGKAWQRPLQA